MEINLAGFNVDSDILKELSRRKKKTVLTPETIAAAYARISRSTESPTELRKVARKEVAKARKSNKTIIFDMGHHSIAEHAVFNFDIIDLSRLAIEILESYRLNAYTEKSQRYVSVDENYLIPEEIKQSPFQNDFVNIIELQNKYYQELLRKLKIYFTKKNPESSSDPKVIENYAKEDARYITALAIKSNLGATINARNLELMLRRFASHKLAEIKELGNKLFALTEKVAPSIVLFHQANEFDKKTYPELKIKLEKLLEVELNLPQAAQGDDVQLVDYTQDADNMLIAAILHRISNLPFNKCLKKARKLMLYQKKEIMKNICQHLEFYDAVLREFEHIHLTYDLVVSASCFAQLKRHRMATITSQAYNPEAGITMPKSVEEVGEANKFKEVIRKTNDAYEKINKRIPSAAQYVLTNAHQKRVMISLNARELYHISRLREDKTAQWDIRKKTKKMVEAAKHFMPLTLMFIGAKDKYPSIYQDIYGKPPKVTESTFKPVDIKKS